MPKRPKFLQRNLFNIIWQKNPHRSKAYDIRDVHYDIVRPVLITFNITSNTSWYTPGYDHTDPSETAIITKLAPAKCTAGSNLEIDRVVHSSTDNFSTLTVTDETSHIEFKKSTTSNLEKFYDILKKRGMTVTNRKEFGSKIDAACGQLRSKEVE